MANLRNAIFDETIQKMEAEVTFETKMMYLLALFMI